MKTSLRSLAYLKLLCWGSLVALSLAVGCRALGGKAERFAELPRIWFADPLERVLLPLPATVGEINSPTVFDAATGRIILAGAGGETVAFQAVFPTGQPDERIRIELKPFKLIRLDQANLSGISQQIDLEIVRFYRVAQTEVGNYDALYPRFTGRPTELRGFPDALIQLPVESAGTTEIHLNPNQATVVWVELHLPKGLGQGLYASQFAVKTDKSSRVVPLLLESWGFDLPLASADADAGAGIGVFAVVDASRIWRIHGLGKLPDRGVLTVFDKTPGLVELSQKLGDYAHILSEHGLEPWLGGVFPRITFGSTGERIDWSGYKMVLEHFVPAGPERRSFWPVPVDVRYPPTQRLGTYQTPSYRTFLTRYLAEFGDRFGKTGVLGTPLGTFVWPTDLTDGSTAGNLWQSLAEAAGEFAPDLAVVDPYIANDLRPFGFADFVLDKSRLDLAKIHCPPGAWWNPIAMAKLKDAGKTIWWRPGAAPAVPDLNVTSPAHFVQALPLIAWRYGSEGVVVTDVVGSAGLQVEEQTKASGEALIYPGRAFGVDRPVPTLRLKMLQRGLQDVGYLRALTMRDKDDGKKELAEFLVRHLVRFAHTDALDGALWSARTDGLCYDYRPWALARLIAGRHLASAGSLSRPEIEATMFDRKLIIQQFRQFSEGLVVESQGVKLDQVTDLDTGKEKIKWTYNLVLRNYADEPVTGTLAFANLPAGFTAVRGRVKISELDWAWPLRVQLQAESTSASADMFGTHLQEVVLHRETGPEILLTCRSAELVVPPMTADAIRIDGRFDDWSEPAGSVAGNFLRVVRDGPKLIEFARPERREAVWPTTVQLAHDRRTLFLAFTSHQPAEKMQTRFTNDIELSGGQAWGEDLVEVLIDPDNRRSLDPKDAFHIVVKANGAVICTRGMASSSMGGSRPWPSKVRAAVKRFDNRWQVEIALPLSDLSAEDKLGRWWGIDFIRLSASISELSSWSAASSQLYKPVSFGNVLLTR